MRYIIFVFFIVLNLTELNVFADDFPFDTSDSSSEEFEKAFSKNEGLSESEKTDSNKDKINIGGSIRNDILLYQFDRSLFDRDDYFQDPLILSLYFDDQFTDDFRLFFRGQMSYDASADTTNNSISPITGEKEKTTRTQLDELKVQFSIEKSLFVSAGVQKLKWGSGHFWNPSDFLNQEYKNLTESEDRRAGLHLVKLHLPINESNLYYIANFGDKNELQNTGHALRYEFPLPSSFTSGEVSFTYYGRKNQMGKGAGDLNFALGPVDFYLEGSMEKETAKTSLVSGMSYEWQYSEKSFLVMNVELFNNPGGASSSMEYPLLIANKQFIPFYAAKKYLATSVYLPKPWSLSHSDLSLMLINNQTDNSKYLRLGYLWSGFKALVASFYIGSRYGSKESEFRMGGITNDYMLRVEYKF